jgi:hypothetical protein
MHSIAYRMFFHSLSDGFVSLAPQCDSSIGPGRRRIGINRSIFLQLHLLKFDVALTLLWCPAVCAKSKMRF